MAFINPSNLYSGGQVVLDSTPYLKMQMQKQAKELAAQDAMAKHYEDMVGKINPDGVRVDEQPAVEKMLADVQGFFMQNKGDIISGGAKSREFAEKMSKVKSFVAASKDLGKRQMNVLDEIAKGKIKFTDKDIPIYEKVFARLDLDDPAVYKNPQLKQRYSELDLPALQPAATVKELRDFDKMLFSDAEKRATPGKSPIFKIDDSGQVVMEYRLDDEAIKDVGEKAYSLASSDIRVNKAYDNLLGDVEWLKERTPIFQKYYGGKAIIDTPEEAARADKMYEASKKKFIKAEKDVNKAFELKRKIQQATLDFQRWKTQFTERKKTERTNIMAGAMSSGRQGEQAFSPGGNLLYSFGTSIPLEKEGFTGSNKSFGGIEIPETKPIVISQGYAQTKEGKPFTGFTFVDREEFAGDFLSYLAGQNIGVDPKGSELYFVDGEPVAVKTKSGLLDYRAIQNVQQRANPSKYKAPAVFPNAPKKTPQPTEKPVSSPKKGGELD